MKHYQTWLLDLDDTLQVGPLSWASIHLFPDIIAQTGVRPDKITFEAAYNHAEALYSAGRGNDALGEDFFRRVGWDVSLKQSVVERFMNEYQPSLFEDTIRFLAWAAGQGFDLYLMTNNEWARPLCEQQGLSRYLKGIFSPSECGVAGKPDTALWDYFKAQTGITDSSGVVMVGNNLITDVDFARRCGLDCILVDRYSRFDAAPDYLHVASLDAIIALAQK